MHNKPKKKSSNNQGIRHKPFVSSGQMLQDRETLFRAYNPRNTKRLERQSQMSLGWQTVGAFCEQIEHKLLQ